MEENKARRVVDALRDRGTNADLARVEQRVEDGRLRVLRAWHTSGRGISSRR